jgi:hypothetical protein
VSQYKFIIKYRIWIWNFIEFIRFFRNFWIPLKFKGFVHRPPPLDTAPHRRSPLAEPHPVETTLWWDSSFTGDQIGSPTSSAISPTHDPTSPCCCSLESALPSSALRVPLSQPWAERPRGLGRHGRVGLWPSGLYPFQQCNFIFSLQIYSIPIQFRSKLVKFVGT